jgi:glycosyltransferase involved in cell wall biosynthesis
MQAVDDFAPEVIHIHRPGMADPIETELMRQLKAGKRSSRRIVETNVFGRVDYSEGQSLIDAHFHLTRWCFWKWHRCIGWGFGIRPKLPAAVVANAVETRDFAEVSDDERRRFRRGFDVPEDAYVCGHVGQGIPSNWNPITFEAFQRLAKICPNAYGLFRGLPDLYKPMIEALPPDVRSRVRVVPMSDSDAQLRELYGSLDCYIHAATLGESFGMALTEAMLCGVPVVTASRPAKGNSQIEVVRHKVDGLVAGSLEQFPLAVEQMWRDTEFRQKARRSVRQSVIDRYDTDRVVASAVKVFEHVLAGKDRREIYSRMRSDPALITDVSDNEIRQMLANTLNDPNRRELRKMWLLHTPIVQRAAQLYLKLTFYRSLRKRLSRQTMAASNPASRSTEAS